MCDAGKPVSGHSIGCHGKQNPPSASLSNRRAAKPLKHISCVALPDRCVFTVCTHQIDVIAVHYS